MRWLPPVVCLSMTAVNAVVFIWFGHNPLNVVSGMLCGFLAVITFARAA